MSCITIVGLGPGALHSLTLEAWNTLLTASQIILRTEQHPCVEELRRALSPETTVQSCDDLYERHAGFADVYAAVVARVLGVAQTHGNVVYAVPGHPSVGEATTPRLKEQAIELGHTVRVVGGLAFVEPCFAAVGVDLMDGSHVVDAMLVARQHYPQVDVNLPLLLGQVYARWLASDVKLTLLNAYPDNHPVTLVHGASTPSEAIKTIPLAEMDHGTDFGHLTSLYVPPLPPNSSFTALLELVAHLRAPEGCPWDREQTLESLRHDLFDEAAELVEAIDLETGGVDNSRHIAEELGDVMLVATMMTQIAAEEGRFLMADVVRDVVTKLIRRHPHVFGEVSVSGVEHVLSNWEAIKTQEKVEKGIQPGLFDGIPVALPALEKARKLQSKASKAGLFDRHATAHAEPGLVELLGVQPDEQRLGQILWELVALAHLHGLNAENALRSYVVRFRHEHENVSQ